MPRPDYESVQYGLINRRPMPRLGQRQTLDRTSLTPRATEGVRILPATTGSARSSVHDVVGRVRRRLQVEQLGIPTTKTHQLIVGTLLHHSPTVKNVDPVRGPYRGEAMRNDQRGPPSQHLMQRGEQLILRSGVEGGCWLVDDHQRRPSVERARDRHL